MILSGHQMLVLRQKLISQLACCISALLMVIVLFLSLLCAAFPVTPWWVIEVEIDHVKIGSRLNGRLLIICAGDLMVGSAWHE